MFAVDKIGFLVFVALFLAVWYHLPQSKRWKAMLLANVVFYLSLDIPGFFVLLISTWMVFQCACRAKPNAENSKSWFRLGLAAALLPLLLKYVGPMLQIFGISLRLWGGKGWLIPLGLSYFTLQLVGYHVDVHTGRIEPEQDFGRLLCYAGFFLSITQGPFNRYRDLMPQLDTAPAFDRTRLWYGAQRMAWGYFKKFAVADRAAMVVDTVFASPVQYDRSQLILAAVLYSIQLYADFSGYTDIVLGAGEMLGLSLPENFRQPFFAATVRELWARWHMSLSNWLRDYVYIPLGGNRNGPAKRDVNLLLTFLASGIWHGVGVTFLVWGALHGLFQAFENHLPWRRSITKGPARLVGIAGTFTIFVFTFTIFRTESLSAAWLYFSSIINNPGMRLFSDYTSFGMSKRAEVAFLLLSIVILFVVDLLHEKGIHIRESLRTKPLWIRWIVYEGAFYSFLLLGYFISSADFLYAQF